MMDFNDAPEQKDIGGLIPGKTLALVRMKIQRPEEKNRGDLPELTQSQSSQAQMLCLEFEIISEPMKGRMFWQNLTVLYSSEKALNISKATIRAMLESSREIMPADFSPESLQKRQIQSWAELDGIMFPCRIDLEQPKNGYGAKNKLGLVITPDKDDYAKITTEGLTIPGPEEYIPQPTQQAQQSTKKQWGNPAQTSTATTPSQTQTKIDETPQTNSDAGIPKPSWAQDK